MTGWLPLSLTLLFAQTPTSAPTEEEQRAAQELEFRELQLQVETLRAQLEAQQQEDQGHIQALQQQQALQQERAGALEQLRQQRLVSLQRAYDWLITADQLLESGELAVGPSIAYAQREISTALSTAADTGRGQTVRLIESALERLSTVNDAVDERDVYPARQQLQAAGAELHEAWRLTLNRPGTTLVNQ
ncbi:hypothetical protein [Archangium sp.]|jgi:hypothetical protein|uniref:hypothetical protein n=1 Tax=Archangium sp. TaxID=1872627 RepID=UPI002ED84B69